PGLLSRAAHLSLLLPPQNTSPGLEGRGSLEGRREGVVVRGPAADFKAPWLRGWLSAPVSLLWLTPERRSYRSREGPPRAQRPLAPWRGAVRRARSGRAAQVGAVVSPEHRRAACR